MNNRGKVSLVYWASGSGIGKDIRIMDEALSSLGYDVNHIITRTRTSKFERIWKFFIQLPRLAIKRELQIHVEQIHREQLRFGKRNILIPNPEITDSKLFTKIKKLPIVFCKSQRAVQLFEELGMQAVYTGFKSEDNYNSEHIKDYRKFLHLAGASNFKGTSTVYELWKRHPEWPQLTIIRTLKDCYGNSRASLEDRPNIRVVERWITEEELSEVQNTAGIHLCPSEMEGFGHYILEGMSVGSVVVTTDAPPMNELVDPSCGFCVKAKFKGKSYMEDSWAVGPDSLEKCIETILSLCEAELELLGRKARARFEQISMVFPEQLGRALDEV